MANPGVQFTDEFIPVMAEPLHREPSPSYIFWQHTMEGMDFTVQPGDTARVEGPTFLTPVTAPRTDRKLADFNTKVSDQTTQSFSMNKQEITLNEYLLTHPLILKEYDQAHSFHDLALINGGVLAEDYHSWRDIFIRDCMLGSSFRRYAGGTTSSTVATTNKITMAEVLINAAILGNRKIPTFPGGHYNCIIDLNTRVTLFNNQVLLDATTRGLGERAFVFQNEIGEYGGVRFIVTNNLPTVTVGASGSTFAGSQAILFGTSLFKQFPLGTEEGLIGKNQTDFLKGWGAGPVMQLNGMPVEVRRHEVTDYGRFREVIWIEHTEYSVLDPNPTNATGGSGKVVGTDSRFIQNIVGATDLS